MFRRYENIQASLLAPVVRNPSASAEDTRDAGSIPGSERSPGEGNGNPLQYLRLENPVKRGAWRAAVHGVAKSRAQLSLHTVNACRAYVLVAGPAGHRKNVEFVANHLTVVTRLKLY